MFFTDESDVIPGEDATTEEKYIHELEVLRSSFFEKHHTWTITRLTESGGQMNLITVGQSSAEQHAMDHEAQFLEYLKAAKLTKDGQSTDDRYPIDSMVNREHRRRRAIICMMVFHELHRYEKIMPEDTKTWTAYVADFNTYSLLDKYANDTTDQLSFMIPGENTRARSPYELKTFLTIHTSIMVEEAMTTDLSARTLIDRLRDKIVEFLLINIPYNKDKPPVGKLSIQEQRDKIRAEEETLIGETVNNNKPILH